MRGEAEFSFHLNRVQAEPSGCLGIRKLGRVSAQDCGLENYTAGRCMSNGGGRIEFASVAV
jgi:hypothetical protein